MARCGNEALFGREGIHKHTLQLYGLIKLYKQERTEAQELGAVKGQGG